MKNLYNEDYYERGIELGISGYSNYRWIPELTIPLAFRLIEVLNITEGDSVLDFGCAKGYLVKALRMLYRQAYGYDTSEYAINNTPPEIKDHLVHVFGTFIYDWVIAKDVLEHIEYDQLDQLISKFKRISNKGVFCIIPLAEDGRYVIPSYELDQTHIIREDIDWWTNKFKENGFTLQTVAYKMKNIKENYTKWERGNGFFILR
ncbi:methyltransferase domain-containing protein [Candidatus Pacearchaeota archaeon]|nr:methyltransferase domain-containing protein [Candidatus Pacearchaeota archaeon]